MNEIAVVLLIAMLGAVGGALVAAVVVQFAGRWLRTLVPVPRRRLLSASLMLPVLFGVATLLSFSAPTRYFADSPESHHCAVPGAAHASHCFWHLPHVALPGWVVWITIAGLLLLIGAAVLGGLNMYREQRDLRLLRRISRWQAEPGYWLVPTHRPQAFAAGLFASACYISEGLKVRLDAINLDIVLAHEKWHVRGHDVLRTCAVTLLARLHLPGTGRWLRREWRLAMEQTCDAAVARETASPSRVAQCLVDVARLDLRSCSPAHRCQILDRNLEARVQALLQQMPESRRGTLLPALAATLTLASVVAAGPTLHRWIEWLLPAAGA